MFVVRLYDGFDNEWIDITGPLSYDDALEIWNLQTCNGTQKTQYADIDYFKIFKLSNDIRK